MVTPRLVLRDIGVKDIPQCDPDLKCAVPVTVDTVMSEFSYDILEKGKRKIRFVTNDLQVFFNQQRLLKLGNGAIDHVMEIAKNRNVAKDLGLSDDQLLASVRSRYIQSVGDVYRYVQNSEYVAQKFVDDFVANYKANNSPADPPSDPAV